MNITLVSESAALLTVVPGVFGCAWVETSRTENGVSGTLSRGWLKPSEGAKSGILRLATLVAVLELRGATSVDVNLTARDDFLEIPSGRKAEGEGKADRPTSLHVSSSSMNLPGDVVIPLARTPNLIFPILLILSVLARARLRGTPARQGRIPGPEDELDCSDELD